MIKWILIIGLSIFSGILESYLIKAYMEYKISILYSILLIIFTILIFNNLYIIYGITFVFIKYCILFVLLLVMSFIDYKFQEVYFGIISTGIAFAIIFMIINKFCFNVDPKQFIIAGATGYLIIWLIHLITHGHGIGLGNAEVFLIVGLFTGCHAFEVIFSMTFIIAFIFSIPKVIKRKSNFYVPLVPYITISTALAVFFM